MTKKETKIKDILKGKLLQVWDDGDFITLAFGLVTIGLTKEEFEVFKEDMRKLVDL